jgi:hypothetical protein
MTEAMRIVHNRRRGHFEGGSAGLKLISDQMAAAVPEIMDK